MKKILLLVLLVFVVGCSSQVVKPVLFTKPALGLTPPTKLALQGIKIKISNSAIGDEPIVTMDLESFNNIILNNSLIAGWMREASETIRSCEFYYNTIPEE